MKALVYEGPHNMPICDYPMCYPETYFWLVRIFSPVDTLNRLEIYLFLIK